MLTVNMCISSYADYLGVTKMLSLLESHGCADPLVLDGGYQNFFKLYPYLCTDR